MKLSEIPKPPNPLVKMGDFTWATHHPSCGEVRLGPFLYLAIHLSNNILCHCTQRILRNENPSANFVRAQLGDETYKKISRWYDYHRAFHYTLMPPFLTFDEEEWREFLTFLEPPMTSEGWFDDWSEE